MKEHAKNQWYRVGYLTWFFDFFGTLVKGQKWFMIFQSFQSRVTTGSLIFENQ
jgi:hypothetical protein